MSEASLPLTLAGAYTQRIEAGARKPKKQGGLQGQRCSAQQICTLLPLAYSFRQLANGLYLAYIWLTFGSGVCKPSV